MIKLNVNGRAQNVDVEPEMPLLWALRDELKMAGTKYGCGIAQCGACTVHVDGQPTRSCVTPVGSVAGKKVVTIEGPRPARAAPRAEGMDRARGSAVRLLPDRA
jgi:isoquinoline 1-oxidoreductase alpha subunit